MAYGSYDRDDWGGTSEAPWGDAAAEGSAIGAGFETDESAAERWDTAAASDVGCETEDGASHSDEGAFTAGGAASCHGKVVGVESASEDVVVRVSCHHSLRKVGLAVKDCAMFV